MLTTTPDSVSTLPLLASGVHSYASELFGAGFLSFFTNSVFTALVVIGLLLWFSRKATSNMSLVPHKAQNFFELIVEFLFNQVEAVVGKKMAPKAFPLLATLFIFILVTNWLGLFPGVGTIGWGPGTGPLSVKEVTEPLFRPATADLNMTLAMALIFFAFWIYWTISEVGVWGFLVHTFGPKGGLRGLMGMVMIVIFFCVGLIELFSILLRNVTLPMRLYGNIFAGESVLHTIGGILDGKGAVVSFLGSVFLPMPFYFMELLVGLLQAMVFTLLCAVYISLSTAHDDSHGEEHH
ncbi:MAG TPA: F0F1 ATP synthase subunit A [Prosthecobacter sp.]|nr:F0F1 ATP synthase subunit A [Prosthecobacter sp.]HRK13015.1 F0F1 ATP synthase subunit A [Prosthecobacter sp.]